MCSSCEGGLPRQSGLALMPASFGGTAAQAALPENQRQRLRDQWSNNLAFAQRLIGGEVPDRSVPTGFARTGRARYSYSPARTKRASCNRYAEAGPIPRLTEEKPLRPSRGLNRGTAMRPEGDHCSQTSPREIGAVRLRSLYLKNGFDLYRDPGRQCNHADGTPGAYARIAEYIFH